MRKLSRKLGWHRKRSNYNRVTNSDAGIHFSQSLFGRPDSSRMIARPSHLTTFNAGDLVPVYCAEVLPSDEFSVDLDAVIRQTTLLTPTMGNMEVDFYAFFVPNRIVNESWKAVEGENLSGAWVAPDVELAPLVGNGSPASIQVPVGSVADYYGFPTQQPISKIVLQQCHDLKFRGYVMIYNEFFRDQNYQPPIPMSTLNVYQGFFDPRSYELDFSTSDPDSTNPFIFTGVGDGSFGAGAVIHSIYGSDSVLSDRVVFPSVSLSNRFSALSSPLKVNKFHDYFTSGLPSPQKGGEVLIPSQGSVNIPSTRVSTTSSDFVTGSQPALHFKFINGNSIPTGPRYLGIVGGSTDGKAGYANASSGDGAISNAVYPANLATFATQASVSGVSVSVNDLRMAAAIQQVYEGLARGGSRYREFIKSFFGLEVDDAFRDVPTLLGHVRKELDLFQTAQTSSSEEGGTPQGNLAAFGYTSLQGKNLFKHKFVEHGYVHIFAVVRHRNIYPSLLSRDNFRLNSLDFYMAPLANISEQPVYTREINPFVSDPEAVFAYQEAWAEYRFEPDRVTGYMRPGISGSLRHWTYVDDFDSSLTILDSDWLKSNSQSVLDYTLAVNSSVAHQFKAQIVFTVDKTRPMPTYSVPGMDIF